jgi:hypothetical protein
VVRLLVLKLVSQTGGSPVQQRYQHLLSQAPIQVPRMSVAYAVRSIASAPYLTSSVLHAVFEHAVARKCFLDFLAACELQGQSWVFDGVMMP